MKDRAAIRDTFGRGGRHVGIANAWKAQEAWLTTAYQMVNISAF